ncbi:MAG: MGMT family protein [Myxococcota bacterium]
MSFESRVQRILESIPPGQTRSASELARAAGRPWAAREAGRILARACPGPRCGGSRKARPAAHPVGCPDGARDRLPRRDEVGDGPRSRACRPARGPLEFPTTSIG